MELFRRRKLPREDRFRIGASDPVGRTPAETPATDSKNTLTTSAKREEFDAATHAQRDLVVEALDRGVGEAELPGLLTAAMNESAVPAVCNVTRWKDGGSIDFNSVDGTLPEDSLQVRLTRSPGDTARIEGVDINVRTPEENDAYTLVPGRIEAPELEPVSIMDLIRHNDGQQ